MELNQIVPVVTKEGYQYLVELQKVNDLLVLPATIDTDIINVVITLVAGSGVNNPATLFLFSDILKCYLEVHDVVLYCYCDHKEIKRSDHHMQWSSQQYRSILFSRMFKWFDEKNYVNRVIVIDDQINGDHYIHLIARNERKSLLSNIEYELLKMQK